MPSLSKKTSPLTVFIAWLIVAIPLGWGLYQSVTRSKPLFTMSEAARPVTPPAK